MEDVAFEVQPGEPAALPNRPRNRHKRERDVSHLCPTAVRLAQRKDELLKAWHDSKTSGSSNNSRNQDNDASGKKSKKGETDDGLNIQLSANASSETDDSKDEEYTVSDEDDYGKIITDGNNDINKFSNDSSEDDSSKELDCTKNANFNNRRHHW